LSETERIARAYKDYETSATGRWDSHNRGNRSILAERRGMTRLLLESIGLVPLADRRVLEVGSGRGGELAWLRELGASPSRLVGIDLLPERVEAARLGFPELEFHVGNAEHLPFPDESFDLLLALTMFSSILDASMASAVAAEMTRVLRPGAWLLWYDLRVDNPSNPQVRGIGEKQVRALFPSLEGRLDRVTLLPPLARRLGVTTRLAYPVLASVPMLRSHLIGLLQKPRPS
jgi:ubiquinone/menaquinone biosynthesis C-methylase UbiE